MALVLRKQERFFAQTADKAMFGMIGLAAMSASGSRIVKEHWTHYKFHHHFEVKLTDVTDSSALAKGDCLSGQQVYASKLGVQEEVNFENVVPGP